MAHGNVEVVRQVLEAWNQRDVDLAASHLAPDIEWQPASPAALEGVTYRGLDEVASATAALWETWDVFRFEEAEIRDLGDSILWLGHVHIKGSASNVELEQEFANYCVLRCGKIIKAKAFLAWQDGLQAAGLRE